MNDLTTFSRFADKLANPLVLVGFALFLFFGIHRALIRSRLLTPLSSKHSSNVIVQVLRYGFWIAVLILLLGFALAAVQTYSANAESSYTDLQLVDLSISQNLALDFKLKNSGTDSAFLTEIYFVFYPGSGMATGCLPVEFTLYDFPFTAQMEKQLIELGSGRRLYADSTRERLARIHNRPWNNQYNPELNKPYLVTRPLRFARVVPPHDVDRFQVRFTVSESQQRRLRELSGCGWEAVYPAYAIIKYDNGRSLRTPRFYLRYPPSLRR